MRWAWILLIGAGACGGGPLIVGQPIDGSVPDLIDVDANGSVDFAVLPASCQDGKLDGDETDVDCGGSCARCANGRTCLRASDCASADCNNNVCVVPASCSDGKLDGTETDIDCGGPVCAKCGSGKHCLAPSDCLSAQCKSGSCGSVAITTMSFAAPVPFSVGMTPVEVKVADFNGDGKPDFVVASGSSTTQTVYINKGSGTFTAASPLNAPSCVHVFVGSTSKTALPDLLFFCGPDQYPFKNAGSGTFNAGVAGGNPYYQVGFVDVDGDADNDQVSATSDGSGNYSVQVIPGNGGAATYYAVPDMFEFAVFADFNGDGRVDVAGSNENVTAVSVDVLVSALSPTPTTLFKPAASFPVPMVVEHLGAGDLDGDGELDIAVANGGTTHMLSWLRGKGDGTFYPFATIPHADSAFVIGDFNGDGIDDIAVMAPGGKFDVLLGSASGTFQAPQTFTDGGTLAAIAVADFDNDGKLDVALANDTTNSIDVMLNTSK